MILLLKRHAWLGFAIAVLFTLLGQRGLNEPDEGRYAEIAAKMSGIFFHLRSVGFRPSDHRTSQHRAFGGCLPPMPHEVGKAPSRNGQFAPQAQRQTEQTS